jgi:hypothetical protein
MRWGRTLGYGSEEVVRALGERRGNRARVISRSRIGSSGLDCGRIVGFLIQLAECGVWVEAPAMGLW